MSDVRPNKEEKDPLRGSATIRRTLLAGLGASASCLFGQSMFPEISNIGIRSDNDSYRTAHGISALMPWADGPCAVSPQLKIEDIGTGKQERVCELLSGAAIRCAADVTRIGTHEIGEGLCIDVDS